MILSKKILAIVMLYIPIFSSYSMEKKPTNSLDSFFKKFAHTCYNQSLWITGGLHAAGFLVTKKVPNTILPIISSLISGMLLKDMSHNYLANTGSLHHFSKLHCSKLYCYCYKKNNETNYSKEYPFTTTLGQLTYDHPFIMSGLLHGCRFLLKKPLDNFDAGLSILATGVLFGNRSHNFLFSRNIPHRIKFSEGDFFDWTHKCCHSNCNDFLKSPNIFEINTDKK
jgi:hypothetical protein